MTFQEPSELLRRKVFNTEGEPVGIVSAVALNDNDQHPEQVWIVHKDRIRFADVENLELREDGLHLRNGKGLSIRSDKIKRK